MFTAKPSAGKFAERFEIISQVRPPTLADQWGLTRDDLDRFALESHRRAAAAAEAGHFKREIVRSDCARCGLKRNRSQRFSLYRQMQTVRRDTSLEKLGTLKTSFRENGRITAATPHRSRIWAAGSAPDGTRQG
jgi:acetyl-CoA acyltransferase